MAQGVWDGAFVRGAPSIARAVRGLASEATGALAVLAPTARDGDLLVKAQSKAHGAFRRALRAGKAQGALSARILHGTGRIPAGSPMVVVAAAARSRRDALVAVELMLNGLKGVAVRRDASKA
ncbi:MAG TPA: molybdenum cofactor biosynthesis protein MoaE [Candidatus Thermoplasmatota archaeon]|nr:molybdenum cofactor biosynthesis protein MoaE [Candidatus Thermoplasmatota archaeon]